MSLVDTVDDVTALAARMFGGNKLQGVLHMMAVWTSPEAGVRVININHASPISAHDQFVLGLARASADVILTTGANLRAEPRLSHGVASMGRMGHALAEWRREVSGKALPPRSAVMTTGRNINFDHPLFGESTAPLVVTTPEGAARLRRASLPEHIELLALAGLTLETAMVALRDQYGSTVAVEAGPSTSMALYDGTARPPDVMLLSRFLEPVLSSEAQGPPVDLEAIHRVMMTTGVPFGIREPSGRWVFERLEPRA